MAKRFLQVLEEMQQNGCQSDLIIYTAVISACGHGGDAERVLQLFVEMQQKGLQPNVITYIQYFDQCMWKWW